MISSDDTMGHLAYIRHEWNDAVNIYKKLLEKNPTDLPYLVRYANSLFQLKKYNEAIKLYDKILKIMPDHLGAIYYKYHALKEMQENKLAIKFKEKTIKEFPKYSDRMD